MKAKLFSGEQVPVFVDFDEAKDAGLLSRSEWSKQGQIVHNEPVPAGIVRKEHVVLSKSDTQVAVSIAEEREDVIVVEENCVEVYGEEQTVKQNETRLPETTVKSSSQSVQEEEGGGECSLMTQEVTEDPYPQALTAIINKKDTSKVNNLRAYVPEGLVLPDNCSCKEQIYWFLGLLYWKHLERRESWDKPINLMYDYLKDNIPNWPEVWRWCDSLELVMRNGYTPGEKAYGYWTAMPYQEQTHRLRTFQHAGLAKRLRAIQRKHFSRPIMIHMRRQLERLSVDMDQFKDLFATNPNRHYYEAHLRTILDGEFRLTADDFSGRFHNNISNMYKPLRAFLRVDGEPDTLGETDIKNSQPLFLGLAAKEKLPWEFIKKSITGDRRVPPAGPSESGFL